MAPTPQAWVCTAPYQFFHCPSNGFSGCCTEDPCQQLWCPNFSQPVNIGSPAATSQSPSTSNNDSASQSVASTSTATSGMSSAQSSPVSSHTEPQKSEPGPTTQGVVIVYTTSQVFETSQATTPIIFGIPQPTTTKFAFSTFSTVSVTTETKTDLQMPTATVTMPALAGLGITSKSKALPSYASRHKREIIAGSFGGLIGLLIGGVMIWVLVEWATRRRMQALREQQIDDHPAMAGRDANRAGDYFRDQDEDSPRNTQTFSDNSNNGLVGGVNTPINEEKFDWSRLSPIKAIKYLFTKSSVPSGPTWRAKIRGPTPPNTTPPSSSHSREQPYDPTRLDPESPRRWRIHNKSKASLPVELDTNENAARPVKELSTIPKEALEQAAVNAMQKAESSPDSIVTGLNVSSRLELLNAKIGQMKHTIDAFGTEAQQSQLHKEITQLLRSEYVEVTSNAARLRKRKKGKEREMIPETSQRMNICNDVNTSSNSSIENASDAFDGERQKENLRPAPQLPPRSSRRHFSRSNSSDLETVIEEPPDEVQIASTERAPPRLKERSSRRERVSDESNTENIEPPERPTSPKRKHASDDNQERDDNEREGKGRKREGTDELIELNENALRSLTNCSASDVIV